MNEPSQGKSSTGKSAFSQRVGERAARKIKAQRHITQVVWTGLGMMGLIGWSVAVPTLLGTALGFWADKHYPGIHSWTLMLLVIGLGLGCFNAWHWISRESSEIREHEESNRE